ncbi:type II secretion system F family protein [Methanogenium organophilum]|uniref:Type II secretion system F family protein n=1 Tax=Methanogenium organophilum TaxID=2199 RepID=A0A9X9S5V7_METOG|nr:type II secretion system F family protein [Methanogenium organophilum]WAI02251.1 type II secretion system F family protein [Methanogenium organophilum]
MIIDRYAHWVIGRRPAKYRSVREDLLSARTGLTIEQYLTYCVLISVAFGAVIGIFGYLVAMLLFFPEVQTGIVNIFSTTIPSFTITQPTLPEMVQRSLVMVVFFAVASLGIYQLLLRYPTMMKDNRAVRINLSLHNAVSYMYAMRRGGSEILPIFKSLSENADVYGEVAYECRQVVRDTEYFGSDVVNAIRTLSLTTPSEQMKDFLEDFVSIIESGGNVAGFLESRVRVYQDDARFQQKQFLSTLQLVAESYVTLFVAGPLFLIIIMVVVGLMGQTSVVQLTVIVYGLIPIGSLIFIIFVDMISMHTDDVRRVTRKVVLREFRDVRVVKREGEEGLFETLYHNDRWRKVWEFVRHPLDWFLVDVNRTFLVTVPLMLIYLTFVYLVVPQYQDIEVYLGVVDDHLIIAFLIVLMPYAGIHELWRRKVRGIEASIPEFLSRLSGINRVGLTPARAISVLEKTNLGLISYEIRRIKRDLDWGGVFSDALIRFEHRVQTAAIARNVTLITKASEMTGDIAEVLSIAANDARMSEALKRERLSDMIIYIIVIYLAFAVFVFVVVVLDWNFLSILEELVAGEGMQNVPDSMLAIVESGTLVIISRLLFHACLINAFFSGLIAGQMGEGSVKAGVKHTVVMLIITLVIFNLAF